MKIERIGEYYVVFWSDEVLLRFTGLREAHDALSSEVTMSYAGSGKRIHWSRFNLSSVTTRNSVAKACEDRAPGGPWRVILEDSCMAVAEEHRRIPPPIDMLGYEPKPEAWLVDGIIPLRQST